MERRLAKGLCVRAAEGELRQVVVTLIGNALDAIPGRDALDAMAPRRRSGPAHSSVPSGDWTENTALVSFPEHNKAPVAGALQSPEPLHPADIRLRDLVPTRPCK